MVFMPFSMRKIVTVSVNDFGEMWTVMKTVGINTKGLVINSSESTDGKYYCDVAIYSYKKQWIDFIDAMSNKKINVTVH